MSWVSLMYHDVIPEPPTVGGGPARFTVSTDSFGLMLDRIAAAGATGCSLSEALEMRGGRPVAVTFDDGTLGQYQHAAPELRRRGMTATFFVVTDWVGTDGFMNWDQLRELASWGMSVQSHTKSHPHLSELGRRELIEELEESRAILDDQLRQSTTEIALPGGDAPRRGLRRLLRECGYQTVATSRWGINRSAGGRADERGAWIRRCNVPRELSPAFADRIVGGERRLAVGKSTREAALNGVRAALGADRYSRWRRRVLDVLPSV